MKTQTAVKNYSLHQVMPWFHCHKISLSHTSPLSAPLHFGKKDYLLPWHSRGCLSPKCLTQKCFHSCNMIRIHTGYSIHKHVEYQANFHFLASKETFLSVNHIEFFFQYFIPSDIFGGGHRKVKIKRHLLFIQILHAYCS